jgi:two-component system phosphate regulon sensor histidine kinase PhoR
MINAIQYGREEGQITLAYYDMGDNILTEVADNGEGINQDHLQRLFERFYRVDKGRSRDEGGTGLGLAIVKHIIEAHQQTINVRSTLGKGTTFGFTLKKAKSDTLLGLGE